MIIYLKMEKITRDRVSDLIKGYFIYFRESSDEKDIGYYSISRFNSLLENPGGINTEFYLGIRDSYPVSGIDLLLNWIIAYVFQHFLYALLIDRSVFRNLKINLAKTLVFLIQAFIRDPGYIEIMQNILNRKASDLNSKILEIQNVLWFVDLISRFESRVEKNPGEKLNVRSVIRHLGRLNDNQKSLELAGLYFGNSELVRIPGQLVPESKEKKSDDPEKLVSEILG